MAYNTNQLITSAYYTAGIVSREFETVSGSQMTDGLQMLNDVITDKTVEIGMIPYESTLNFNLSTGVEEYDLDNLIRMDTATFFLDDIRYALRIVGRDEYFGSSRVENIQTLPCQCYFERGFGGGKLYVYFIPNENYPFEIHGLFRLDKVALFQDLELTIDQFYISYLRYALADRICTEFNYEVPMNVKSQIDKYQNWIIKRSRELDLRMQKISTLNKDTAYNWGYVNLGRGWTVPG